MKDVKGNRVGEPDCQSPRFRVIECHINRMTPTLALDTVRKQLGTGEGGYICFSNVHTVVTSKTDRRLLDDTNNSFMSLPDGRPLSIYARLRGYSDVDQVAGPDFMETCLRALPGARHFFYGSTDATLKRLVRVVEECFPGAVVAGSYSPPFRPLEDTENEAVISMINAAQPDFVWVGLGAPKQERWMAQNWVALRPALLMGVGAAFDFHAGTVKRCPGWMSRYSLEWIYRLCQEPRRLWKRYFVTNTLFLWYVVIDVVAGMLRRNSKV
ncbi:MAG TPA: glycosyltransferase [Gammaproteobacteria bacterium]|nr:glycosyltransferase [Gammaproteobacteria bacterium]